MSDDDLRRAERFREQAAECRGLADETDDPFFRDQWKMMAEAYDQLAGHAENMHEYG